MRLVRPDLPSLTLKRPSWAETLVRPALAALVLTGVYAINNGGGAVTGSASNTARGISTAANGAPAITGSASQTAAGMTQTAQGGAVVSGSASNTAQGLLQSASGSPVVSGSAASMAAGMTGANQGAPIVTGSAASTGAGMVTEASGGIATGGTANNTALGMSQTATGTPVVIASAANTALGLSQSAGASPVITASAAQTAAGMSQTTQGAPIVTGSAANTALGLSQSAQGAPVISASAANTGQGITTAASGAPVIAGQAAQTAAGMSQSAAGTPVVSGSAANTANGLSQSTAAAAIITASAANTARGITTAATGSPGTTGPTWVGEAAFVSGTTTCSPDFTSSGRTTDDMLIIVAETANRAVSTPSGWSLVALTPASGTAGAAGAIRLTMFYKRSAGTETTVALTATSADHITAYGMVVRGVDWTAVTNRLQNSTDLTNGTYWHPFAISPATASITGGVLTISGVTSGVGQGNAGIYTDSFATLASGSDVTLLYEIKASTGTQVSAANIYATAGGLDVDNFSPDVTSTTTWTRQRHKVTLPANVTYSNMGYCVGSALADTSVVIRNVMLVVGDVAIDYAYTPTLSATVTGVAAISSANGAVQAATTSVIFADALTYKNNSFVINVLANDRDIAGTGNLSGVANASLANLTTRVDQCVATGQGGGLAVITGDKATAGAVSGTTATNSGGASVTNASITLVLAGP